MSFGENTDPVRQSIVASFVAFVSFAVIDFGSDHRLHTCGQCVHAVLFGQYGAQSWHIGGGQ